MGFVAEKKSVYVYNHFDSYPDHLGEVMLEWARNANADDPARIKAMRIVSDETDAPTREDVERLANYTNLSVNQQATGDTTPNWYQLLRETQGNPDATLAAGVYEDASNFPLDSLFCEWGYVVDFDLGVFEVYRGFQKAAHEKGRFATKPGTTWSTGEYYPVALMASWALEDLPNDESFLAELKELDSEDE